MIDKDLIKAVKKKSAAEAKKSPFFDKFTKRLYISPKGYKDYYEIALNLSRQLFIYTECYDMLTLNGDFTHMHSASGLINCYQNDYGVYYLDKELFNAFLNTTPPVDLTKLNRPLRNILIILPKTILNPDGYEVNWIMVNFLKSNENIKDYRLANGEYVSFMSKEGSYINWFTILDDLNETHYCNSLSLSEDYKSDLDHTLFHYGSFMPIYTTKSVTRESEMEFSNIITDIVIHTIMYLNSHRDLYCNLPSTKTKVPKQLSKRKLKGIILGENFRPRYMTKSHDSSRSEDADRKVITHWRRGHYRWQPYGSRENPQYKSIWIEPILINEN